MDSEFSEGSKQETINSILCVGTESKLFDCQLIFEGSESCGQYEDAGIVCQGRSWTHFFLLSSSLILLIDPDTTEASTCNTGEVRLVGTENVEDGTLEGRVEVCINNAWGTVCDNLFGQEDAETVCASVGGFYSTGE